MNGLSLQQFTDIDDAGEIEDFLTALATALSGSDLADFKLARRAVVFPQPPAFSCFSGIGQRTPDAGVLSDAEPERWKHDPRSPRDSSHLFGAVG